MKRKRERKRKRQFRDLITNGLERLVDGFYGRFLNITGRNPNEWINSDAGMNSERASTEGVTGAGSAGCSEINGGRCERMST